MLTIGTAPADVGELEDVFEGGGLSRSVTVEFIEVDEAEFGELGFYVAGGGEVEVFVVVGCEWRWHQHSAEGAFAHSLLLADEDGNEGIGGGHGVLCPLCDHGAKPDVECFCPNGAGVDAMGERCDAVDAVPRGELLEIVGEGLISRDGVGVEDALDIDRPCSDVGIDDVDGEGVERQAVDGSEGLGVIFRAIFGFFGEEVVAEVVVVGELLENAFVEGVGRDFFVGWERMTLLLGCGFRAE